MGCFLNPTFLQVLPGRFKQMDKTRDWQSETKAAVRGTRVRRVPAWSPLSGESLPVSHIRWQKLIFICIHPFSLTLPNNSLDYKLLPVLKGKKVVLILWTWAWRRLMGFPSYNHSRSSFTVIRTGVKENDCSCQGFRNVWASHMQMLVSLTFPDFDWIGARNVQSPIAKAGKIASDVIFFAEGANINNWVEGKTNYCELLIALGTNQRKKKKKKKSPQRISYAGFHMISYSKTQPKTSHLFPYILF